MVVTEAQARKRYVGPAIYSYMKDKGIKQTRIVEKLNEAGRKMTRPTFNDMLHARCDINAEVYFDICAVLDVPISTFENERKQEGGAE